MHHSNNGTKSSQKLSRRALMTGLTAGGALLTLNTSPARSQGLKTVFGSADQLQALGMELTEQQRAAGVAFLGRHPSIDVHCHPGRFFLRNLPYETPATQAFGEPFERQVIADLEAGGVSAALFATVSDMRVLEVSPKGIHAVRPFAPGEAFSDYLRQIANLRALVGHGGLRWARNVRDIHVTKAPHKTAAIFSVEGGDFIEDRLDRVHRAYADGVRAITIVHYRVNQIGDIQTEAPVYHGLTPLGKKIVHELNAAGIVIDLSHATFDVTKDVLEISDRPVMVSHSNLATSGIENPRLISEKHADIVADHGGIIGAIPWGIGQKTFADYVDSILRLVDHVGIDHVAIGTDMDATFQPVFSNYRDWPLIPAALLAKGLHDHEVARIMGGNFLRIFGASVAGRRGAARGAKHRRPT